MAAPKTIGIYSGGELLGDAIIKLPFLQAMRRLWPTERLIWIAGAKTALNDTLRPLITPYLDDVLVAPELQNMWASPSLPPLSLFIDTQRSVLFSWHLKRQNSDVFVSGAGNYLFSQKRPPAWSLWSPKKRPHLVDTLGELLLAATGKTPDMTYESVTPFIPEAIQKKALSLLPKTSTPKIGIAPGAGSRWKCYPLAQFIEVAQQLQTKGHEIIMILGPAEEEWYIPLKEALPAAHFPLQSPSLTPQDRSPLLTLSLASHLTVGLCNDSGVGHLMGAANIPLLTLFGPTPATKFRPITTQPIHTLSTQKYGATDMAAIPVADVVSLLEEVIETKA